MSKDQKEPLSSCNRISYFHIKYIKKCMFCPDCKNGKMTFNKKTSIWACEDCDYHFSEEYFLDNCVFWFCDECEAYLNNQEGFDRHASRHICSNCGYENDTTLNNIKGICSDCGKLLPNPDSTLCADCRQARREKAKQWLITAGKVAAGIAVVADAVALAANASGKESTDYTPLPDNDDDDTDDEVYGLGKGNYPMCKTCGAKMTDFDGWAWYTCPECGDKVRIIEGKETWYDEIFGQGKKQHHSDYELADFCHGGDLTDE